MTHTNGAHPGLPETLVIPHVAAPLSLRLPAEIAALREEALSFHQRIGTTMPPIPELILSDAAAWAEPHRGRGLAALAGAAGRGAAGAMPVEIAPGERIVGRPRFRDPAEEERPALDAAHAILAAVPPFPGGDAGHLHPDTEKLFRLGVRGLLDEIAAWKRATDGDAEAAVFYDACRLALEGMSGYINRVADACGAMAGGRTWRRRRHWSEMAAICRHVATEPPRTFHEAIELLFLALVALWQGEGHYLTSPGRLDRTLRPFYEADLAAGRITPQAAFELIVTLYIQVNRIMSTGLALAVMVGGRDAAGNDVTNDLTYLCMAARVVTGLGYPTVGLCWHRAAPPELIDFAVQMLAYGRGDPAFFNDELIVEGLHDHGVAPEDAPDYMNSTCVEIKPVGASNIWVTAPYFNVPQALLDEMNAVATGAQPAPVTFEELEARVRANLTAKVAAAAAHLDRVWRERATPAASRSPVASPTTAWPAASTSTAAARATTGSRTPSSAWRTWPTAWSPSAAWCIRSAA